MLSNLTKKFIASPNILYKSFSARAVEGIPRMSAVKHPYELNPDSDLNSTANKHFVNNTVSSNDRFAVIEFSGRQYKVAENDVIVADLQKNVDIGSTVNLDKVLLVGSKVDTYLGHPYIDTAAIQATVEEITQSDKVMTFKHRRRKNSKRLRGFRRDVVTLRIDKIHFNPEDVISTSRLSASQPPNKMNN